MNRLKTLKQAAPSIPYNWQRPQFKSGDIFAQSHGSWDSWKDIKVLAVRAFTLSSYSHVGVIEVDPLDGHIYAIEAVKPVAHRVRLSTLDSFYHLPMPANWTLETSAYVRSIMGTEYSEWDAIRAFFSPLPAGKVTECAALTREVLMRSGVDLGPMSRPDSVVQRALELGSTITYVRQV